MDAPQPALPYADWPLTPSARRKLALGILGMHVVMSRDRAADRARLVIAGQEHYHIPMYDRELNPLRGAGGDVIAAASTAAVLFIDDAISKILGMLGAQGQSNRYSDVAIRYKVVAEIVDVESGEVKEEIALNRPVGPGEMLPALYKRWLRHARTRP